MSRFCFVSLLFLLVHVHEFQISCSFFTFNSLLLFCCCCCSWRFLILLFCLFERIENLEIQLQIQQHNRKYFKRIQQKQKKNNQFETSLIINIEWIHKQEQQARRKTKRNKTKTKKRTKTTDIWKKVRQVQVSRWPIECEASWKQ